ncbi:MAG: RdgB/HAM1 family non-canonical purine NTP pyrophosphatase [Shewanellaceae bacterium]|nr:RdgB/HAM1 family non-canonical purine NTP pyrophosphatase [Shewanellaceae bacterium]
MKDVILATHNSGKINEFKQLFQGAPFELIPANRLHKEQVAETGTTFVENAIIKARHAAELTGKPAIADDSGIEVDALHGRPGIYSARYLSEQATQAERNQSLMAEMALFTQPHERRARFQCVLVFMRHGQDPSPIIAQGTWEGVIHHQVAGQAGHGYDPIFFLPDLDCTAAELDVAQKNTLSHRSLALRQLVQQLKNHGLWHA